MACEKIFIQFKDVDQVFTSHVNNKLSYHIVLPDYSVKDEKALLNFYHQLLPLIDNKYHSYIDDSVYKNTQQFRILGSHKFERNNNIMSFGTSYFVGSTLPRTTEE